MTIKCDHDHPTLEVPTIRTVCTRRARDGTGYEQLHWDYGRCPEPDCQRDYASLVSITRPERPPPKSEWSTRPAPTNPFRRLEVDDADPCQLCGQPADGYTADGKPWCDRHLPDKDRP